MRKNILFAIIASLILTSSFAAQFPIKIPKIEMPKTSQPANNERERSTPAADSPSSSSIRQMVMDDGYTFFRAEPVKVRNPQNDGDVDAGWYLVPKLRLMGTFPDNSGFRLVIKQNGKELSKFFCGAMVYRQEDDRSFKRGRQKFGWGFDDFMNDWSACSNTDKGLKALGWMDVEIFYVDGATDEETLVRKHRIDVHKAAQIRGYKPKTSPGVSEYFIQRYAETAVGIIHTGGGTYLNGSGKPFAAPTYTATAERLQIMIPFVPDKPTYYKTRLRCSVNGKRIALNNDAVQLDSSGTGEFVETAMMQRNDPKYSERITFTYLTAKLPLTLTPGKWECAFMENGEAHRTIRFEVGPESKIVPHPEQESGNINLYHKAFLVDVEIPTGGSAIDGRLLPMPDAGIFYGIPWSTPEGKAAAAGVPKKGNPYPVMPR